MKVTDIVLEDFNNLESLLNDPQAEIKSTVGDVFNVDDFSLSAKQMVKEGLRETAE